MGQKVQLSYTLETKTIAGLVNKFIEGGAHFSSAKNLLKPFASLFEWVILAPLSSSTLIAALSDLPPVTLLTVSQVLREFSL